MIGVDVVPDHPTYRYFTCPVEGGTITLDDDGVYALNFIKGELKAPDGTTQKLKDKLRSGEYVWYLKIRESGGQDVDFWIGDVEKHIRCLANDEREIAGIPTEKVYIQRQASGAVINIEASTNPQSIMFSAQQLKRLINKKTEWGTPTTGTYTPSALGALETAFALTVENPGTIAIEIDISALQAGESGRVVIEAKVDGSNWRVLGNAEYDNTDFSLIDDCAPAPSGTAPKKAHQWAHYIDSGTDIRMRVLQTGGSARGIPYAYNTKTEV